ncbi:MAG TPA: NAD(P)H-dependent oxidoreductase [Ignavibacteria bacterium]
MGKNIVAGFAGSLRDKSYNKMALKYILKGVAEAGGTPDELDLKEFNLPVYDGDIEDAGEPENVTGFRNRLKAADGIVIVTPEYNHSIPGGLKNAIDWASRGKDQPFKNKTLAIAGCTPFQGGTIRAQVAMLPIFRLLGANMINTMMHISNAGDVFDVNGEIKDEKIKERLINLGREITEKIIFD